MLRARFIVALMAILPRVAAFKHANRPSVSLPDWRSLRVQRRKSPSDRREGHGGRTTRMILPPLGPTTQSVFRSCLPRRHASVRCHQREGIQTRLRWRRDLFRPAEANGAIGGERRNIHCVALISTRARSVAMLVAPSDDGDVATPPALHRRECAYRRAHELGTPVRWTSRAPIASRCPAGPP